MRTRRPTLWWAAVAVLLLAGCGRGGGPAERLVTATPTTLAKPTPPSTAAPSTTVVSPVPSTTNPPSPATTAARAARPSPTVAPTTTKIVPRGPYTDWNWASPAPGWLGTVRSLNLTVLADPGPRTPYFFAHQFHFVDGDGGYLGLQTSAPLGPQPGAPLGKIAIFSMFGGCDDRSRTSGCPLPLPLIRASAQPGLLNGSFCLPLTSPSGNAPEGSGATCRVPYEWREGATYGLQVAMVGADLWEARVVEGGTGEVTVVGRIQVPGEWGGLSTFSVSWIEYYGDTNALTTCAQLPLAQARWDGPGDGQTSPGGLLGLGSSTIAAPPPTTHNHLAAGQGLCPNSSVTDVAPGPAAVQALGGA